MERTEAIVAAHYGSRDVMRGILEALERAGVGTEGLTEGDLTPVDEFHTGGLEATEALLAGLTIPPGTRVLDLGCGIGGPARLIAERYGVDVVGVDLTEEYVATARELSRLVGLAERTSFLRGSVTALPVADASADLALMQHVGMNVADKAALFAEAARVLAPGGVFALFDVMRGPDDRPLDYPVPWASTAEFSFVAPPEVYRAAAEAAGFRLRQERDRTEAARDFFARMAERVAASGPPILGTHLLMGSDAREKIANYLANLESGRLAPTEMIFDRA
jgi:ubiquinone/menaquinone biosynthesis C-methylase UbiE